jgi:Transport and Golgi organisation 2
MCTVTVIPSGNSVYFTSSRDENAGRPSAEFPRVHEIQGLRCLYPKDPPGGGSWIAAQESGCVAILLNGAIKAHITASAYRKSRGMVLLDLISNFSPADSFEEIDFSGIEPFTVILFEDGNLYSGKWDGRMKWLEPLNSKIPHIWSSVTLYDPEAILKRERWFHNWLRETPYPGTLDIFHFHQKGGDGDPFNDILMNRQGKLFTNSISSIRLSRDSAAFRYLDLCTGESAETFLSIQKKIPVKS